MRNSEERSAENSISKQYKGLIVCVINCSSETRCMQELRGFNSKNLVLQSCIRCRSHTRLTNLLLQAPSYLSEHSKLQVASWLLHHSCNDDTV